MEESKQDFEKQENY